MSTMEHTALDMSTFLLGAYEIGDMIKSSAEVATYLYWKQELEQCDEVQALIQQLNRKKELYEECQRFGHFHPDYHAALDEVKRIENKLDEIAVVQQFKVAEEELDDLLYQTSVTLAHAVSDSIKVPTNKLIPESGCSNGGSCSGKCS